MIILSKSDCILFYKIDQHYFENFDQVVSDYSSRSFWRTAPDDSYSFNSTISFSAKNTQRDHSFIEYQSCLTCNVKIDDEKADALQILNLVKEQHEAMNIFISENSLSHFSKLQPQYYEISDPGLSRMEEKIISLKTMKKFEDKNEIEKQIEKEISRNEIKTNFEIKRWSNNK